MMKISLPDTILRAAGKCCRMVFDTNSAYWFEKDLDSFAFAEKPRMPVRVDHSIDETVAWINASGERWMRNPREFSIARNENHIYAVMKHDNRIIGYIKAGMNRVYIDDFKQVVSFPPRCAFFYDIYVAEEYRKMNLATFLAAHTMSGLKERGYTRVRLHIPAWNSASMAVARKLGFRQISYTRVVRLFSALTLTINGQNEKAV